MSLDWSTIKKGDLLYEFSGYGTTAEILALEDARENDGGYEFKARAGNKVITVSYRDSAYKPKLSAHKDYAGSLLKIDGTIADE